MLAFEIVKRLLARFVRVIIYHPVSSGLTSFLLAALLVTSIFPISPLRHPTSPARNAALSPAPAVQQYMDGLTQSFDARKLWQSLSGDLQNAFLATGRNPVIIQRELNATKAITTYQAVYYVGGTQLDDGRSVYSYYVEVAPKDGASPPDVVTYTFVVDRNGKIDAIK
jgi:hypothetical protein